MSKLMEKLDDTFSRNLERAYTMHGIAIDGGKHIKVTCSATSYAHARSNLKKEISECIGVVIYKRRF